MQPTTIDTIRTPAAVPYQQHQSPPAPEPSPDAAAVTDNARRSTSTEDYVTLTSRTGSGDPAPKNKPSQPVSSNEKQALLKPGSPYRFSVYG